MKKGAKVTIKVKNYRNWLTIEGKIKETRSSYGHDEYLVTDAKVDDFWSRKCEEN